MTSPIRILIADNELVSRRAITRALRAMPNVEVLPEATTIKQTLEALASSVPDILVVDPDLADGSALEAIRDLANRKLSTRIVVFSSDPDAKTTLSGLQSNTFRLIEKPGDEGLGQSLQTIERVLIPAIQSLSGLEWNPPKADDTAVKTSRSSNNRPAIQAVVFAVSTGGPEALAVVLPGLPKSLGVPILIVQHMPEQFTARLAGQLDGLSSLTVREAQEGDIPEAGVAYIAPGGHHMIVHKSSSRTSIKLHDGPKVNSCRPAADILFDSAASVYGSSSLAVVMTGMGADGAKGALTIRQHGGQVIVQSPETCVVAGMPGAAIANGSADIVVGLNDLAPAIVNAVSRSLRGKGVSNG